MVDCVEHLLSVGVVFFDVDVLFRIERQCDHCCVEVEIDTRNF